MPKNKVKLEELEKFYIREYRKLFGNESLYNLADGGTGGNNWENGSSSEEQRKNIGKYSGKQYLKHKKECHCYICDSIRYGRSGNRNGMFGKHFKHTKETIDKIKRTKAKYLYSHNKEAIEKIKMANLKRVADITYIHPMLGKHLSGKQCEMISIRTKEAMWKPKIREKYLAGIKKRKKKKDKNSLSIMI